ncbi:hypothetical protein B0I37DRAFT_403960 [Chaetomium sp. MPI-CAGE-AT-0009]|nr:hypothetical protein B0I37DRAFT_403960 [Chaetomium sp. MPI-CAGE-AT-0009]
MSQTPISPALRAWYKWKALRLPWRRQFLVGLDLHGNTYWEFLDRGVPLPPRNPNPTNPNPQNTPPIRWRRMVRCPPGTHQSSVSPPPAWHQWLRHTRADPPTLLEQQAEVARRARMRVLAAEADARWEAKPRVAGGMVVGGRSSMRGAGVKLGDDEVVERREETWKEMRREAGGARGEGTAEVKGPDPWKQARGGPSETWQPKGWEPAAKGKK